MIDARPKVNAIGNVIGPSQGGYELGYEKCVVKFLNIENIHVVRESWILYEKQLVYVVLISVRLRKLIVRTINDVNDEINWLPELEDTGWLKVS